MSMSWNAPAGTLRPRNIGDLLDATFRQYKQHFSFLFRASAFTLIPYLVLDVMVNRGSVGQFRTLLSQLTHASSITQLASLQQSGHTAVNWPGLVALGLISLIVMPLLYGAILHLITHDALAGGTVPLGAALRYSASRLWATIITNVFSLLLWGVAVAVTTVLVAITIGVAAATKAPDAISIILGVIAVIIAIVVDVWLAIRFAFRSSVAIEERRILWPPLGRSWVLTRGNFWRTFGFFVLIYLMLGVLRSGVNTAALLLIPSTVLASLVTGIVSFFTIPFGMLATANLYVDLRIRTDGMDLQRWLSDEPGDENPAP